MKANPGQQEAIETRGRALVVEAGAGTGKTRVLVERFVHLLAANPDWPLESIIAITFTKKAAREMRTRLRQTIEARARKEGPISVWAERRRELERLKVSTIHSLCAHILRENAISAGVDPGFESIEEADKQILQEEAVRQAFIELVDEDHPGLALLASLSIKDVREELAKLIGQRGTVQHLFDSLEDQAGLLEKWHFGLENMRLALWREELANPEAIRILEEMTYLDIPTGEDKLKTTVQAAQDGCLAAKNEDILTACQLWDGVNLRGGKKDFWGSKEVVDDLKADLTVLRDAARVLKKAGALQEIDVLDEQAASELQLWKVLWEKVASTYERLKEKRHALDFDDLEIKTMTLLSASEKDQRLEEFLRGIRHVMVDEFQDTNQVQQAIIYALAHPSDGEKLFVVGDAKQSIYRFRQAQVSVFNRTSHDVKAATGLDPVTLDISYRTHGQLVRAVNHIFENIFQPQAAAYEDYEARPGALIEDRETPDRLSQPVEMIIVPSHKSDDPKDKVSAEEGRLFEAEQLALRLHELHDSQSQVWDKHAGEYRNFRYSDAAILFRATTVVPLYEEVFKRLGLPYLTISGRGYYDRPEVRDLLSLLSVLNNSADDLNLASVLRSPLFGLSDETLFRLRWYQPDSSLASEPISYKKALLCPPSSEQDDLIENVNAILQELWKMVGQMDVWRLLKYAIDRTGYEVALALFDQEDGGEGRQRNNIQKFLEMARDRQTVSLSQFLQGIQDLRAREAREGEALGSAPESGAVQIMTIHASKGLEFPVVVVADLGRPPFGGGTANLLLHDPGFGLVCRTRMDLELKDPAGYMWGKWLDGRMEEAETKRLMYVALTRAADHLILSGQQGGSSSWMTQFTSALDIPEQDDDVEVLTWEGFSVEVKCPAYQEALGARDSKAVARESFILTEIPALAQPFSLPEQKRHFAVTHLQRSLKRDPEALPIVRPAVRSADPAAHTARVPHYLIGLVVHHILENWDWLSLPQVSLEEKLIQSARREGIHEPDAVAFVLSKGMSMLDNLRASSLFEDIQQAKQRFSELPFVLDTPLGKLHGVIDLLFQDRDGEWHLVEWKTDWVDEDSYVEKVDEYRQQIAVYVNAVQSILSFTPEAHLCFLALNNEVYSFDQNELEDVFQSLVLQSA
jgi:ATP-dependent helicase/nuclease subunit A